MFEKIDKTSSSKQLKYFLDYYLLQELVSDCYPGYAARIQNNLAINHNLIINKKTVYSRIKKIRLTGKIRPAAEFNGIPGIREGKDQAYAGFWTIADLYLPNKSERRYIGLPANQITVIAEYVHGPIIAIEKNTYLYEQLIKIIEVFHLKNKVLIFNGDLFQILSNLDTNYNFNIFDFDLMQSLPNIDQLTKWVQLIFNSATADTPIVLNLAATIGRTITENEHIFRIEQLFKIFQTNNMKVLGHSRFGYKDRQIPIRTERFVLEKKKKN